ncbi:conserved hypothetical protein [Methanothermus fervidus DSM 2088]|uniref:Energy-converting hydrogenase A, subunit R n=1 Tax=Methanothermus fervidus (strain ATCC 43054 / DSM 2088 / JCM 10308 / V24 S) TaxID=523846 RepID=E3GWC6_METFV|nr:hypothetical protein [Methanothermus fervidus]ADP77891.1 conserved hypothetical protein [Methanothermus fervidus DSM 2088]
MKLFISDCEGPITLNDNAFELSSYFIPEGDKFFEIVSKYDDILAEEIKRPGYQAGNTLKLILPFLKAYGATDESMIKYSKDNINLVPNAKHMLKHVSSLMNSFIVSTSYEHYIKALCDLVNFPFDNTYSTKLQLDKYNLPPEEKKKIIEFRKIILSNPDIETLDKIFFEEIPKMEIGKIFNDVEIIGSKKKKEITKEIIRKNNSKKEETLYIGDSITDIEVFRFLRSEGLAISFNGNEFAVKEANIVVISPTTDPLIVLSKLHSMCSREEVFEFVKYYCKDPENAIQKYCPEFKNMLKTKPTIVLPEMVDIDKISERSLEMRKNIRGEKIGGLG